MTFEIITSIILFGIALAMDAFAVSITDGLIYSDINKKRSFFIAGTFGFMQAFMPMIGYFAVELISQIVGSSGSNEAIRVLEKLINRNETLIFYESPHHIKEMLKILLNVLGNRQVVLARELTKINEEYIRGTLQELNDIDSTTIKGEIVLIVS